MKIETKCVHGAKDSTHNTGAVSAPIYQTSTFSRKRIGETGGYDYSRLQNPTREYLENTVAALDGGNDALAFASGMAAVTALTELFAPGDELIASDDLYGGTIRLFDKILQKNGVTVHYVDTSDISAVEAKITPKIRAVFVETPTNPMMIVTDIKQIADITKERGILLIVDNTFLTPYYCRPIELGADIVVHSGTKYLGGHNDVLAGFLVTASGELSEKLRYIYKTTGGCLGPFDSFLVTRGIKTLAIRMDKSQSNALAIADWLKKQPWVKRVYYVGLPDHPQYELTLKQTSGFGAMISFEVDTKETAHSILNGVELILFAESLGGTETLITYPTTQTHADVPDDQRNARGINDRLLRLSVGIESVEDIIADLAQAVLQVR
jgi:cystathionine gamma-synthase